MAIRVALHHKTEYIYDRPITLLPQVVRLRPAPHCRTPIISYSLKIEPGEQFLNWQQDPYSNYLARLVFPKATRSFKIEVDLIAEMTAINPFDFFVEADATEFPFTYEARLAKELTPFLDATENGPALLELAEKHRKPKMKTNDFLVEINQDLQKLVGYVIRLEPGIQTCEHTLTTRKGSCRDSAWLMVQTLRHLGLAARFVSGYLIQLTADIPALDGPSGPERDFTDLHAWAEVYLPGAGWIGLDPTSGLLAGEGHIPLACTADPVDAAPITGSFQWIKEGESQLTDDIGIDFNFAMSVQRVHEDPRVTKPYTEDQWQVIDDLGHRIDIELAEHDVRLTMGGEPTFVAIDDKDAEEWNTGAMGPTKRVYGDTLLRRLRDRFAPEGFLFHGQGKWYPGEVLPRWAFAVYWRKDGLPIWTHPEMIARDDHSYGYTWVEAQTFITELARLLNVDPEHAIPGYEDSWYYMWRERRLPTNVDPLKSEIDEKEERLRLAKIFDQGLKYVIGYALPLKRIWSEGRPAWQSGHWLLRREHLFLIPGDSPMGYRLPLDSLPWAPAAARDTVREPDPFEQKGPLPRKAEFGRRVVPQLPHRAPEVAVEDGADPVVRTTLCVEARQGRLHVFMPPQHTMEDYLDIVAAIEATAVTLNLPVQLEGYDPPYDARIAHLKVTPDPGVIEVNVHPSAEWGDLVHKTEVLYEEARQTRLCAEKFQLDGKHTGTMGGNHVILGGLTPADSPILRRPDLLRSLISYWHNHPSLSYMFSGLFLGPTSQAPRLDEARNDSLYEMELAFAQVPEKGSCPPWLVDRIFRHLLTDVSGNTHRSEFCIDKLYSPDGPSGRHGLLEFRAFEMPPHARMSLTQQLLMRSLVARFWKQPYKERLVRWGTELHDKFMLPHFVSQDFRDVLAEMRNAGYAFDDRWFDPHYEFRFPTMGSLSRIGMHLELRQAIEPWHVLGEEGAVGGTARYVDSSVERLQVKVQGMVDGRHVLTCNGRRVPLFPTGTNGEYVAGIRYRAWQPPSCLHPTIPVHTPLVFDLYDGWMKRAIAGCMYHVAHPGGRSYDTFPVNANEAEGRRINRFYVNGHTPTSYIPPLEVRSPEAPLTLDLRVQPVRLAQPEPPRPAKPLPYTNGKGTESIVREANKEVVI